MNHHLQDNLKKIRKDHNLSQEQLAEELGVTRQAISKWESGVAYPEMEKIIQLCDLFDLNIDDLLHRDIRESKGEEITKNNLNKYMNSFLSFVTDSINLFCSMRFMSKVKFLFEQLILIFSLVSIDTLLGALLIIGTKNMIDVFLPWRIYQPLLNFLLIVYVFVVGFISVTLLAHIFKVRYLDYYVKIKKGEKEAPVDLEEKEEKEKISFKRPEEKIIIRDPKHSEYRFFSILFKGIVFGIKFFAALFTLSLCFLLVLCFTGFVISFSIRKTGLLFVGVILALLAAGTIDTIMILYFLNFIFNRPNQKKKMIWGFIISVIVLGMSFGFLFLGTIHLDIVPLEESNLLGNNSIVMDMQEQLMFLDDVTYIEEDIENIRVEYKANKLCKVSIDKLGSDGYLRFSSSCDNPLSIMRAYLKEFNNGRLVDMDSEIVDIRVYASSKNIATLKENYQKYYEELENHNNEISYYKEELATCKENAEGLEAINHDHENHIYYLETEYHDAQERIEEYQESIREYKTQIQEYKDTLSEYKREIDSLKNN